jgi:uncharacterized protein
MLEIVMIHKFILNGFNIILDVNSGAVFSVDPCVYDMVDYIELPMNSQCPDTVVDSLKDSFNVTEIMEAYDEIFELYSNDSLFSNDCYEDFAAKLGPAPIKSMCLNVAHDCNLRCSYCFASQGDFGSGKKLMSYETGAKAIDFLISHSGVRKNLEVDFFGGEPLMNLETVKRITDYARGKEIAHNKHFRFTITTNGILLNDSSIDYINNEMSNVVLSIDGRKHINDKMRMRADGSGTYDTIIKKYRELVARRGSKEYYVRGTYTRNNLDFAEDVIHLINLGFDQISIEPAVSDCNTDFSIREKDLPKIYREYEHLADLVLDMKRRGAPVNFFHFMLDLDQGPCAIKRLRGCSCGNEYIAVTPEGDIYPCHQFVGQKEWLMGSVLNNNLDQEIKYEFSKATVYEKESCKDCWAKFYCSGGCNANNHLYQGSILSPHKMSCEIEKKRLECAIMIKVAMANNC